MPGLSASTATPAAVEPRTSLTIWPSARNSHVRPEVHSNSAAAGAQSVFGAADAGL